MDASSEPAIEDVARLRACLSDLVGVLALPAMWAGCEPPHIVSSLLNALFEMLQPAFVFVCLGAAGDGASMEMAKIAGRLAGTVGVPEIRAAIARSLGPAPSDWPAQAGISIGLIDLRVATARLGLHGEIGGVIAGSERRDFPAQTEMLVLAMAANQAAIGLQQAHLLDEQRRVAKQLDEQVAERTSELVQANEALSDSKRDSQLIVDNIPGSVALLAPDGAVQFVNRQILEYTGQTLAELNNWATNGTVHPADLPHVAQVFGQSIATGVPYEIEQRLRRADDAYRWFLNSGFPLRDGDGHIRNWCVLLTDIDERKQAEVELRRAYDSFADAQRLSKTGSFITDLIADDHNWSEETYRIFDFEHGSKVTLARILSAIHPDDLPSFEAIIGRAMSGENVNFSFRIVIGNGAVKHIRGVAHVIERVEGRPMFVGALQDVTETALAEENLSRARSELAHVSSMTTLSALTASIAHEVNQPLSGIITNAGTCLRMLDDTPPNLDGARETVRRTIRDGNRAADVIARLRSLFTRKEFAPEPLDLNEAVREVMALSFTDLQRHHIAPRIELDGHLPIVVGDRVQLQQVILNLVRNASDAMADVYDRPRTLLLRTEPEEPERVRVSVRDAGVGIDPDSADRLFNAFYTTKSNGMGVGLFVCRSIIERHHGRLWAEMNQGSPGTTFAFSIPATPEVVPGPVT